MPPKIPELSKAEWLVMKQCWALKGKSTARQVFEEARQKKKWEYQTVKTMLDRLVAKGYLRREKLGPLCLYQPTVSQSKTVGKAVESFLDTVLDNTFTPLFAHLAKERNLSDADIQALRRIVENEKGDGKDD